MADYKLRIVVEGKDDASKSFSNTSKALDSLGKSASNVTGPLSKIGGSLDSASSAFESFSDRASSSFQRVAEFAAGNLIAGGISKLASGIVDLTEKAIGLGVEFVNASNDFNAGLANVASLGVATDHIETFKSSIQSMAVAVGKDTKDLTGGLYQVVSAFGDNADTVKILEINARAAAAGVAETTDAINLTSAVTKGYGDTSANAVKGVTDLALKTVELGQTTFPELASSVGKVVPLSKQLGVSQEELFAVLATGSGVTGTTGEVATQYRGILQSLMAPTETMSNLIGVMGFESGSAMLEQKGLAGTLDIIVAAANRSGLPLQQFIGSIEGQTLALALAGPQQKKYQDNLKGMQSAAGKTDEAFNAQTGGINKLGFKLKQAGIWWETFKQKSGDAIGSALMAFEPLAEPFLSSFSTQLENFIPQISTWAENVKAKVSAAFNEAGGGLSGAVAGLGAATGGTLSVKADVTSVDWTTKAGDLNYSYDAAASVYSVDWTSSLDTKTSFIYDAGAKIGEVDWTNVTGEKSKTIIDAAARVLTVDWNYAGGEKLGFTYDAKAGITSFNYNKEAFSFTYDAKAQVTTVDFAHGTFKGWYTAQAGITNVAWGLYYHIYDAKASVAYTSVLWGAWTKTYEANANVTTVLWGAYTHNYDAGAKVSETSIVWGAWTKTYDAIAKIGETGVLWGAWSFTYDAKAKIGSENVLWGAWTTTYDAKAGIGDGSVLWGAWTYTYDATGNITSVAFGDWTHVYDVTAKISNWIIGNLPTGFGMLSGGSGSSAQQAAQQHSTASQPSSGGSWLDYINPFKNASGTDNFAGGWTWVGEKGPELLNLPAGSKILSNQKSMGMIGKLADGNTGIPAGLSASEAAGFNKFVKAMDQGNNTLKAIENLDRIGPDKIVSSQDKNQLKLQQSIDGMFAKAPGLMQTSEVTQNQLDMAALGIPQNFADDWVRHLTDEVVNGVQWKDADIKDAAMRAGIDPSLPAKAILGMVKDQWNSGQFFADAAGNAKNTDLLNMDAIKQSILQQQQQAAGKENLMQLSAIFGGTAGDLTQQGQVIGGQARAGIVQGLSGAAGAGAAGSTGAVDLSTILLGGSSTGITPEAVAPLAASFVSAFATALTGSKDDKDKGGIDFGAAIVAALTASLGNSDALAGVGQAILQKITESWKTIKDVDFIGGMAAAMALQIDTQGSIDALKNVGAKIAQLIKKGIDDYFKDAALADSISNSVSSTTSNATPVVPGTNASGTSFWKGGLSWVGERGAELVNLPRGAQVFNNGQSMAMAGAGGGGDIHIHATINTPIDVEKLAYRVSQIQQKRGR